MENQTESNHLTEANDLPKTDADQNHPYHSPVFTHHGSVTNIVKNQEGVGGDGGGGFGADSLS